MSARRAPEPRGLRMSTGRRIPRPAEPRLERPPPQAGDEPEPSVAKAGAELAALSSEVHACEACERACPQRAAGTGHPRARVLLLKESPAAEDLMSGNAFAEEAEPLAKAFDALGVPMSWVYGTCAVRCGAGPSSDAQREACATHLLVELEAVQPKVVVAFGPAAASALRSLDGRCGLAVPEQLVQGEPLDLRRGLWLVVTEPLPDGVRSDQAKRRLWRDLRLLPGLLG